LGQKRCPVSGIDRIRYSGCFITLKLEGKNSGPTKLSGFIGIPVLRGSGLEGFYCTIFCKFSKEIMVEFRWKWRCYVHLYTHNLFLFGSFCKCIYKTSRVRGMLMCYIKRVSVSTSTFQNMSALIIKCKSRYCPDTCFALYKKYKSWPIVLLF